MRYRLITFLVFGVVLVGIGEWAVRNRRLQSLDRWWLEFCVANAREKISDPAVTLVRIDGDYVPVFGDEFTRADYAAILGFVSRLEPRSVAFEPVPEFDESILVNQDALAPLKEAALTLPELTLGTVVESGAAPENPGENLGYPVIENASGDLGPVFELTRTVAAPDAQMMANGQPAFTTIELGSDSGAIPKVPLLARQGENLVAGFVLQAIVRHAGLTLDDVRVSLDGNRSKIAVGDHYSIPIDASGYLSPYEHSGIGRQPEDHPDPGVASRAGLFKSVSAFNLTLTGEDDPEMQKLLADLQDEFESMKSNLVVIGDDHEGNRHATFSNETEAVSHAHLLSRAIATIQSGRYITWLPGWARLLGAAVIFGLAIFLFRYGRRKLVLLGAIAALIYFAAVVFVFKGTLAWAPPFSQLALFALLFVIGLILPDPKKTASRAGTETGGGELHDELGEEHEEWSESEDTRS